MKIQIALIFYIILNVIIWILGVVVFLKTPWMFIVNFILLLIIVNFSQFFLYRFFAKNVKGFSSIFDQK